MVPSTHLGPGKRGFSPSPRLGRRGQRCARDGTSGCPWWSQSREGIRQDELIPFSKGPLDEPPPSSLAGSQPCTRGEQLESFWSTPCPMTSKPLITSSAATRPVHQRKLPEHRERTRGARDIHLPGGHSQGPGVPLAATKLGASTAVGLQTHPKRTSRANACAAPAQLCQPQQAGMCVPDAPCFGRRGGKVWRSRSRARADAVLCEGATQGEREMGRKYQPVCVKRAGWDPRPRLHVFGSGDAGSCKARRSQV